MTKDRFEEICLNEFPKIEAMVKTVKALGVDRVTCVVFDDGHIDYTITEKDKSFYSAFHVGGSNDGSVHMTKFSGDGVEYLPTAYYDHAIDNDVTEDDLPFT